LRAQAAEYVNDSDIDIVNLQHEFGLFDGVWGAYVLSFLEKLEKPIITTLHTVLLEPEPRAPHQIHFYETTICYIIRDKCIKTKSSPSPFIQKAMR
jgi:predicted nucleotidyltransferase